MIYCFDLDNTLCSSVGNDYSIAEPFKNRILKVNRLYDQGHTIIIDSARGTLSKKDLFELTQEQLKSWGVKYHYLRTGVKFFADHYVDDKAINDIIFFK